MCAVVVKLFNSVPSRWKNYLDNGTMKINSIANIKNRWVTTKAIRNSNLHYLIYTTSIFLFIIVFHCAMLRISYLHMTPLTSMIMSRYKRAHTASVISGQKNNTVILAPIVSPQWNFVILGAPHIVTSHLITVSKQQEKNLDRALLVTVADAHTLCIIALRVGCS